MKQEMNIKAIDGDFAGFGGAFCGIIWSVPLILCFIGLLVEIVLYFLTKAQSVAFSTQFAPWLPIFCFATPMFVFGIIVCRRLRKIAKYPISIFIINVIISSVIIGILQTICLVFSFIWYQSQKIGYNQSIEIIKTDATIGNWSISLLIACFVFFIPTAISGWVIWRKAHHGKI